MTPIRRPSVSFVLETGMSAIFWLSSLPPLVSDGGGPRCETRLVRLICCLIILRASSPWSLLICYSLAILLLAVSPLPLGWVRFRRLCSMTHLEYVPFLLRQLLRFWHQHHCLCVVLLRIVRLGSLPTCWRLITVTQIPKGPLSSSVANYRPISIHQ